MPPRAKAKAKAGAKRLAQRARRARQLELVNARGGARRTALRQLNAVVEACDAEALRVNPKAPEAGGLQKLFRFLARRELDQPLAAQCRRAVLAFTENGGLLPEGISLREAGSGLATPEEGTPLAPGHKVLKCSFRLHSRAFMVTYNSAAFTLATWAAFEGWVIAFAQTHGARAWAACLEESTHAASLAGEAPAAQRFHLHAYFLWVDETGLSLKTLDTLRFENTHPRVDVCKGAGSAANFGAPTRAALHGLWYVAVKKAGTAHASTNFVLWLQYSPSMAWLGALWDAKKLSHEAFLALSADFRSRHSERKRDAEAVMRQELEAAVDEHVATELSLLAATEPLEDFRQFPPIDAFVECFRSPRRRRPILVLVGGTNSGKSLLGAAVLRRVAEVLAAPGYLEIAVESDEELHVTNYDHRRHAGLLLDGVGDALTLWRRREMLQGRPAKYYGGKSATMIYSYPFTLARRAVVVTMDLAAKNLDFLRSNHWLKDPRNVSMVWLDESAWVGGVAARQPAGDAMRSWGVGEVVSFLQSRDAAGLAQALHQNAVAGADLLGFASWQEVARDLSMSAFAARKLLSLRDAFLAS